MSSCLDSFEYHGWTILLAIFKNFWIRKKGVHKDFHGCKLKYIISWRTRLGELVVELRVIVYLRERSFYVEKQKFAQTSWIHNVVNIVKKGYIVYPEKKLLPNGFIIITKILKLPRVRGSQGLKYFPSFTSVCWMSVLC